MKHHPSQQMLPRIVAVLSVVDAALFIGIVLSARGIRPVAVVRRPGGHGVFARPAGFTPNGRFIPGGKPLACWAARFEIDHCEFCQADDKGEWGRLAGVLAKLSCPVFVLPPGRSAELPERDLVPRDATQELYISMDFVKQFRLTIAPTTLIFGPRGELLWSKQGELGAGDYAAAVRSVRSAGLRMRRAGDAGSLP